MRFSNGLAVIENEIKNLYMTRLVIAKSINKELNVLSWILYKKYKTEVSEFQ